MLYVIQVTSGAEKVTGRLIEEIVREEKETLIEECFFPQRVRKRKYGGTWNVETETLFPGYLFVRTDHIEEVMQKLRAVPRLTKLLGMEGDFIYPLSQAEAETIERLGGREHVAGLSKVTVEEGNRVKVREGILKDYEGQIIRVNLHKRIAVVRIPFMGAEKEIYLGIEILENQDDPAQGER